MKVRFFARLREALGAPELELSSSERPADVAALRRWLRQCEHPALAEAMTDPNVICAVNQHVATDDQPLQEGDEVAFYPPVTGG
jgi:molybdopterin converting factor subunit 1